jgi:hypothetical protein
MPGITSLECLLFQPVGDKPLAGVNIHLTQASVANVDELVWRLRRDDDDLSRLPFERLVANGEERSPFEDDKHVCNVDTYPAPAANLPITLPSMRS